MPTTIAGWVLFALMLVSSCATATTATTLILVGLGRARYTRGDIALAYLFGAILLVATALFLSVEPPKV